jgi:hypothetical protein
MLPSFDYSVTYELDPVSYSQNIRMNYLSFTMSYYFSTWEVFNGDFLKRTFN